MFSFSRVLSLLFSFVSSLLPYLAYLLKLGTGRMEEVLVDFHGLGLFFFFRVETGD